MPLDIEAFMKTPAWFDNTEINNDNEKAFKYDRAKEIKRLLFEVNSYDTQLTKESLGHALRRVIPLGDYLRNYT